MNAPISTYSSCVPCPVHGCASHRGTPTVKGVVPLSQPSGTGKPGGNWRGTEFPEHRLFEILMLAAQDLYRRKDNTAPHDIFEWEAEMLEAFFNHRKAQKKADAGTP